MSIASDPNAVRRSSADLVHLPERFKLQLQPKDVVSARVLRQTAPNEFLLAIRGGRVQARAEADLQPGRVYVLEVKTVEPRTVLALAPESRQPSAPRAALARVLEGLNQTPFKDLAALLKGEGGRMLDKTSLSHLFQETALFKNENPTAQALKGFIRSSGLSWEAKVGQALGLPNPAQAVKDLTGADLKGLALSLLASGGKLDPATVESLTRFVDSLQGLQLANAASLEDNARFFLSIPFLQDGEHRFIQFMADLSRQSGGRGEGREKEGLLKASLCLDMTALGPLRVDAALLDRHVRAGFVTASPETASFLETRIPRLQAGLAEHGFVLDDASFRLEEASVLENLSLADEVLDSGDLNLDVII